MAPAARIRAPRRAAAAVALALWAAALSAGAPPAEASCLASLRLDGRTYIGHGILLITLEPGPGIGYALQPPCNDTEPPLGPTEPTRMAVRRITGVSPRVAVLASHGARGIVFVAVDRCRKAALTGGARAREVALLRCLRASR
ncbi:MAG: hypothetical protein QOK40_3409 [Miltoncostaeaceae bacterium]|jgi:hypothetical protein|nr:hypothetical protein [Miltoncostaeaceae bacterium]